MYTISQLFTPMKTQPTLFGNSTQKNLVARIENTLIYGARYKLLPREQKIILYLISKIDALNDDRFHEQTVPVRELENLLKRDGSKWGGLYKEMVDFTERIQHKGLRFDTDVSIKGRVLPGFIQWFQSVIPTRNEEGEICIEFMFAEKLRPFLLQLQEYTRVDLLEILPLRSGFSIRLFQIFRARLNQMARHERESYLHYSLDEFKRLLDIENSYKDFRNLRKRVLDVATTEINEKTGIAVKMEFERKGRKVIGVHFYLKDTEQVTPADLRIQRTVEELTFAQLKAYEILVNFGVKEGIALKQILSRITSSEADGFEDMWVEECLQIFRQKAKGGVGAFVKWFLGLKVFEQGDHYATIMERLQKRKKKLQRDNPMAWDNRQEAKTMTAEEFRKSRLG